MTHQNINVCKYLPDQCLGPEAEKGLSWELAGVLEAAWSRLPRPLWSCRGVGVPRTLPSTDPSPPGEGPGGAPVPSENPRTLPRTQSNSSHRLPTHQQNMKLEGRQSKQPEHLETRRVTGPPGRDLRPWGETRCGLKVRHCQRVSPSSLSSEPGFASGKGLLIQMSLGCSLLSGPAAAILALIVCPTNSS